ncbi:PQQ-dependent sugar dehydrogenase, partial [Pseudomonas syringae group genomosp. 7]|uniref:PQQ-dependent sugar dehydrogenase n=1 Tax=Pseudomonas syringae group genomosp. 7 TaxID=251699 RepID=UPI003770552C
MLRVGWGWCWLLWLWWWVVCGVVWFFGWVVFVVWVWVVVCVFLGVVVWVDLFWVYLEGEKIVDEERLLKDMKERIRDVGQGPDGYV